MKPRVTTTLWEDEGTLCFQVEAKGICVARREGTFSCFICTINIIDNNMVNGTKLLNVAGMSRGKRDGILKSEKSRAVVKVGAMHLKGVWYVFFLPLD
jgi:enhanced filamentous growth protein 1